MVEAVQKSGKFPPAGIQPADLDSQSRKPDLVEFQEVVDLNYLVQCVEVKYCHHDVPEYFPYFSANGRWPFDRTPCPPEAPPEDPEGMEVWKLRFHKAVYTTLLLGALLAGAYHKPFLDAEDDGQGGGPEMAAAESQALFQRRKKFLRKILRFQNDYTVRGFELWATDIEYLRHFPAYDFNGSVEKKEEAFGTVASWLVVSTLTDLRRSSPRLTRCASRSIQGHRRYLSHAQATRGDQPFTFSDHVEGTEAEAENVLWLIMQIIHIFEFLQLCFVNHDGREGFSRGEESAEALSMRAKKRTVIVVLFGIFQVEEITLPDRIEDAVEYSLLARPISPSALPGQDEGRHILRPIPSLDFPLIWETLYLWSGIPNHDGDFPTPPPPLQFFTFLLQKYFNLRFTPEMWDVSDRDFYQAYREFKARATLFSNGFEMVSHRRWPDCTNGTEYLVTYSPPALRYEELRLNPRTYEEYGFLPEVWRDSLG